MGESVTLSLESKFFHLWKSIGSKVQFGGISKSRGARRYVRLPSCGRFAGRER